MTTSVASVKAPSAYSFNYEIVLDILYACDCDGVHGYWKSMVEDMLEYILVHEETVGRVSPDFYHGHGVTQQR